jgi:osmotically-inducible protein OsmY
MHIRSAAGVFSLAACLRMLTGCNAQDARNIAQDTGRIAKDAGVAAGNAQLAARVNTTLAQRKGVHLAGLHVEAKDGVVTISGHVNDANEKRIVRETVEGIRGVDKLDVSPLKTEK